MPDPKVDRVNIALAVVPLVGALLLLVGLSWVSAAKAETHHFFVSHEDNQAMTPYDSEGASRVGVFTASENATLCELPGQWVMVPGLGLSSSLYTSTPDGRTSWAEEFAQRGSNIYVVDPPFNTLSGIDSSRTDLSQWSLSSVYSKWGFGESVGQAYPDSQYPVDFMTELELSFPEYFIPRSAGQYASRAIANNVERLLEDIGPSILVVHSASGVAGFELMERVPHLITAIVVLEPVGCPGEDILNIAGSSDIPFITVYGDYVAERGQNSRYQACSESVLSLQMNGGSATFIDLPAEGITGNSHLFTQGLNLLDIANRIAAALTL